VGHVAQMGEKRNAYRILVGKAEGKSYIGRWRHRWVDNIKMDLRDIGWGSTDWIYLAQDKYQWRTLVNIVLNCQNSLQYWKFFSSCTTDGFSRSQLAGTTNKYKTWILC
jgi:hypothetical protein